MSQRARPGLWQPGQARGGRQFIELFGGTEGGLALEFGGTGEEPVCGREMRVAAGKRRQAELFRHRLAIFENLEPGGEFHRWEVSHFLQEWQVAIGLDVAGDAGIAIPVPGAADVTAFFADADIVEPGLA